MSTTGSSSSRVGPDKVAATQTALTLTIVLALGVLLAVGARSLPAIPTAPGTQILAAAVPHSLISGERAAMFAGASTDRHDAVLVTRICAGARCPVDRSRTLAAGTWWGWVGNAELPSGTYQGSIVVLVEAPLGMRAVHSHNWEIHVE